MCPETYGVNKKKYSYFRLATVRDSDYCSRPAGASGLVCIILVWYFFCVLADNYLCLSHAPDLSVFRELMRSRAAEILFIFNSVINLILSCCFPFLCESVMVKKQKEGHAYFCVPVIVICNNIAFPKRCFSSMLYVPASRCEYLVEGTHRVSVGKAGDIISHDAVSRRGLEKRTEKVG